MLRGWKTKTLYRICTKLFYSIYSCHLANKVREEGQCKQSALQSLYWNSSTECFKWKKLSFSLIQNIFSISRPNPPINANTSKLLYHTVLKLWGPYTDSSSKVIVILYHRKREGEVSLFYIYFVWQNRMESLPPY